MQPGSAEHAMELENVMAALAKAASGTVSAFAMMLRHQVALTCAFATLAADLERRGVVDRVELADMAAECVRIVEPNDPEIERIARDLFGTGRSPPRPPQLALRVIEGGRA